jgi:hypothetical protein
MAKSKISNIRKKRKGRPRVDALPIMVRVPPAELDPIDAWIGKQKTLVSRPEAIRRLVEIGLARSKSAGPPSAKTAERAKQLAAKTIDRLTDPAAHPEEAAHRKRRLLKGPEEFREVRVDRKK